MREVLQNRTWNDFLTLDLAYEAYRQEKASRPPTAPGSFRLTESDLQTEPLALLFEDAPPEEELDEGVVDV